MAADRRAELVQAGLDLAAQLRFGDVLDAVETKAVADAAGVGTGSFFHHFRSRRHFAEAATDRWIELWGERVRRLAAHAVVAAETRGHPGVRDAAGLEWDALVAAGTLESIQHVLWALRDQPLGEGTTRTARDVLADAYAELAAAVRAEYERGMRVIEREPMPPFTQAELEVMTTALAEGLQLRAAVDPDVVRSTLYGDAVAALLLGSTRPRADRSEDRRSVELADLTMRLGPTADVDGPAPAGERWRAIAEAAAPLFVDASPHEVRWSEVAAAAGVPVSTVKLEFASVTAVAAAGCVRHVPELRAIAEVEAAGDADPLLRIEALLLRYVELIRENRGATEALLSEIVAQARTGVGDDGKDMRAVVPLVDMLEPLVGELRRRGRLRRRVEVTRLARSLVHLVTMQGLLFPHESPARVVDETLTMVFDGVLVPADDR